MKTYRLLQNMAFEPQHIETMAGVLKAISLDLNVADDDDKLRGLVARKVIEYAQRGARHPERLRNLVMSDLGAH